MNIRHALSRPEQAPLDLALAAIPSLPRALLARLVERAIDRLDEMDGDTDIEPNGDEQDFGGGEDDCPNTVARLFGSGPGCPLSDPAEFDCRDLCTLNYCVDQTEFIPESPRGLFPIRRRVE